VGVWVRQIICKKEIKVKLNKAFREHDERLKTLDTIEPKPGELSEIYLEKEFEEKYKL
jgi:hypothetical protein